MHTTSPRPSPRTRSVVVLATAASALLLLGGCAQEAPTGTAPTIATLETASPVAGTPSASSDLISRYGRPPRARIDDDDADTARTMVPFNRCMRDQGSAPKPKSAAEYTTWKKAADVCSPLQPAPPWQYDRANPKALAFVQRVVSCLHSKGVTQVEIAPDDGSGRIDISFGDQGDSRSIALGGQYLTACQQVASSGSSS